MQHGVEQRDVGSGQQLQVQIGEFGGFGTARVDDDDAHLGPPGLGLFDASKSDGMRPRRVAARQHQTGGMVDVVVAARRRVSPQRDLVAGHRAAHAHAGIGVHIVGADQALGQLVEDVVVLSQHLP